MTKFKNYTCKYVGAEVIFSSVNIEATDFADAYTKALKFLPTGADIGYLALKRATTKK